MYAFKGYYGVQVYENEQLLLMDGYDSKILAASDNDSKTVSKFAIIQKFHQRMQQHMNRWRPEKQKNKWDIYISDRIQNQLFDPGIREFLTAIENTHKTLRRNLGGVQEISGLRQLAQAIEMEDAIEVSDASLGSRGRASHGYIVESKCGRYRILGVSPRM